MKLEDIANAVLKQLTLSCAECDIFNLVIEAPSFACFSESPTSVTYRARVKSASETDSDSLISLIEEWVSDGARIIVNGVLMTVDSECSVAISSLSEGECLTNDTTTNPTTNSTIDSEDTDITTDSTATTSGSTATIIGGIVAIICYFVQQE